jgi:hypothetical protein
MDKAAILKLHRLLRTICVDLPVGASVRRMGVCGNAAACGCCTVGGGVSRLAAGRRSVGGCAAAGWGRP